MLFHYRQPPDLISGHRLPESYLVCPASKPLNFCHQKVWGLSPSALNGPASSFHLIALHLSCKMPCRHYVSYGAQQPIGSMNNRGSPEPGEQILLIERFLLAQLNYHHQATAQKLDRLMEQIYYAPNNRN